MLCAYQAKTYKKIRRCPTRPRCASLRIKGEIRWREVINLSLVAAPFSKAENLVR